MTVKWWEVVGICLVASLVTSFVATWRELENVQAQEEPLERETCDQKSMGMLWSDGVGDMWTCNGWLWVEVPNAGVIMIQPWAVFVLYAGGTNQILLFSDGNEASLQARAISGIDLKSIECVAIYYKGDLMNVEPPTCNVMER